MAKTATKPATKTVAKKASRKASRKATPAAVKDRPSTTDLRAKEDILMAKYPKVTYDVNTGKLVVDKSKSRIVKGSIQDISTDPKSPHYQKVTVVVTCAYPGCVNRRRIATSDLHQVIFCEEHTLSVRQERRRKARKASSKSAKSATKVSGKRKAAKKRTSRKR